MSCDSKIDSFHSKSKGLLADLSYGLYKEVNFGNTKRANEYARDIQNIESISWLLDKHEKSTCGCAPVSCLCTGASSNPSFGSESFVSNTLDVNGPPTTNVELWKGILYNNKTKQLISVSSRALDVYDPACEIINGTRAAVCRLNATTHKSLRFWSWEGNVPTLLFDTEEIFDGIQEFELVSFYYSELHNSYFLKTNSDAGSVTGPIVIKVSADFSSVVVYNAGGVNVITASDPSPVLMEVVDSLNFIFIKRDANNLDVHSLVDMSLIKTITTTGFPYQKMTWSECECNLILTGGGDSANGVIHVVDHTALTVTNKLDTALYKNNTSIVTSGGKLLVLSRDENTFEMVFQKWNTCDDMTLLESVNTGVLMGAGTPGFQAIHSFIEDADGSILVTYLTAVGSVALSVFDKDFNLKFTKDLGFGSLGANIPNSWTNTNINFAGTNLIIHDINQNGVGGVTSYYLDYSVDSLEIVNPTCVVLTDEEICSLVNKLDGIKKVKKYGSITLNSSLTLASNCDRQFVFDQNTASAVWTINHNLGCFPQLFVLDTLGNRIYGSEAYPDNNTVIITFSVPIAGTAYLTY